MKDKNGRKLRTGDYITCDLLGDPNEQLMVHWGIAGTAYKTGWFASRIEPLPPTPQRIDGLSHRITIVKRSTG